MPIVIPVKITIISIFGTLLITLYNKVMFQKILLPLFLIIVLGGVGLFFYLSKAYPTVSPFITDQYYIESIMNPHKKMDKHVMGFLPYWRLDDLQYIRPQLLSEINYFSLTAGADGKIVKVANGQTEPGWRSWQTDGSETL